MTEVLAQMDNVGFGTYDGGSKTFLHFTANALSGSSLQLVPAGIAIKELERLHISDVKHLNERCCVIDEADRFMKFVRLFG